MPTNVLVLEKEITLEMEGIKIGNVKLQVFEAEPVHIKQGDMNEKYLLAKGIFNDKKYEVKGVRGGVQKVVDDLIKEIKNDLK